MKLYFVLVFLFFVAVSGKFWGDSNGRELSSLNCDYIIVGAGTAGAAIAARLSERRNLRVCLFERGTDRLNDPSVAVPTVNFVPPVRDLSVLPTEHFHSFEPTLGSRDVATFAPFALGGGPSVSGSFWGRGDAENYNEWARLLNDTRFTYQNLIPYFAKTENVRPADSASPDRGNNGPIEITFLEPSTDPSIQNIILPAHLNAFNTTFGRDFSLGSQQGTWPMQRSLKREATCTAISGPCTRQSPYHTYLEPVLSQRTNLQVVDAAQVVDILYERRANGNRIFARGVEFLKSGRLFRVQAREEVILSAGTFNSPKLLMHSGIGPASVLQQADVPVLLDLPAVGKNLQDHVVTSFAFLLPTIPNVLVNSPVVVTFTKSPAASGQIDVEVPWGLLPSSFIIPGGAPGGIAFGFLVQLGNNSQLGELTLRSSNPFERPDVQFNFDASRFEPLIWSLKKVRQWFSQIPSVELRPGLSALPSNADDETIRNYLRGTVTGWYHMSSTCKMARDGDPNGVVDTRFRVRGVRNLRVVDNSVLPVLVTSHPSATAVMLGELAADFILNDL